MAPPDWVQEKQLTPDEQIQRPRKRSAVILEEQGQEAKTVAPSKRVTPRMPFHGENGSITATYAEASQAQGPSTPDLCDFCARSLHVDDGRDGGFLGDSWDGFQNTLCFTIKNPDKFLPIEYAKNGEQMRRFLWRGNPENRERRRATPPSLPELSESCQFCGFLKALFTQYYEKLEWWCEPEAEIWYSVQHSWSGMRRYRSQENGWHEVVRGHLDSLYIVVEHPKIHRGQQDIQLPIAMDPGPCRDWLGVEKSPLDTEAGLSQAKAEMIQGWIRDCESGVDGCKQWQQEKFVPKRLLDLGADETFDPILIETKENLEQDSHCDFRYICLSYCWGQKLPIKTTSCTIDNHKRGMPLDTLPLLFRDTIAVTRTLGIRYLWIDSLCIIQDSKEDWATESGKMADIFAHSWLTIGAATATSCNGSLFGQRKQLDGLPFQSSLDPNVSGHYSIYLFEQDIYTNALDPNLRSSKWNTRGWVWQEQILSPRLLVFGDCMISMDCHDRIVSEDGVYKTKWHKICPQRRETYKILAAVSGFAKSMIRALKGVEGPMEYAAGIWLSSLLSSQLLWIVHLGPRVSFRELTRPFLDKTSQLYAAPSWSWASCDRHIRISVPQDPVRDLFSVKCHQVEAPDNVKDAMIAVKHGSSITLRGFLRGCPSKPTDGVFHPVSEKPPCNFQAYWETPYRTDQPLDHSDNSIRFFLNWIPNEHDKEESNAESKFKLFLLGGCRVFEGLLLWPIGGISDSYIRVGSFQIGDAVERRGRVWEDDEIDGWIKEEVTIV
ncbi:Heterokaryon incompatibility protein [Lasiodiplodia theobromae]|uniref:Heterokaryon incompatibility protein n=1 Tax=Lasiodiplodia theobromae TaxID=45133 RepID=UPI0015C3CB4B|nr:Heterokaryon incompatibility protein [Lasiodiplodia theobromae]KAF4546203.1 Heterokaryon incompatibility protein [Lasiodiplodia theobromae]